MYTAEGWEKAQASLHIYYVAFVFFDGNGRGKGIRRGQGLVDGSVWGTRSEYIGGVKGKG